MLNDADAEIAQAAAAALGRIATPAAVDALFACKAARPDAIQPAIADGLLAAAQRLAAADTEAATAIYEKLSGSDWPEFVRTGAFYGLAAAQPAQAPNRLINALRDEDPLFRNIAASVIGETSGAADTKAYADAFPTLPPQGQAALVRGLMARKDPLARPVVVAAAQSANPAVKAAAVKALSVLGMPDDVPMLAALLDNADPALADAANYALTFMQGDGVNNGIASAAGSSPAPARAKLIELLATRRAEQALPIAVASLTDSDAAVRIAAMKALQPIAGQDQAAALLDALKKSAGSGERTAAERTLVAVAGRTGDALLKVLQDELAKNGPDTSVALLHVVARIRNQQALETVLAALDNKKEPVREEAVRIISDWPTLDAAPHLLVMAQSKDLSHQVLGLRGYVRLVGLEPAPENKIKMLNDAMALAKRPEEKKAVVGAWAAVFATQSLDALRPALDDPDVQNEAAAAILAVATEIAKNPNAKPAAIDALNLLIQKSPNPSLKEKAQNTLAAIQ
ncbi:MAG: HEAT repeat domain-containing protein [Candidatus Hydrogenedentes bacterium]|nr:HEAT repeat domain-containing protein [Candidatus Hydrogenedentota bacterium]